MQIRPLCVTAVVSDHKCSNMGICCHQEQLFGRVKDLEETEERSTWPQVRSWLVWKRKWKCLPAKFERTCCSVPHTAKCLQTARPSGWLCCSHRPKSRYKDRQLRPGQGWLAKYLQRSQRSSHVIFVKINSILQIWRWTINHKHDRTTVVLMTRMPFEQGSVTTEITPCSLYSALTREHTNLQCCLNLEPLAAFI